MNSRIRTTATGALVERIATEMHIFVEPVTNYVVVQFQGEEFLLTEAAKPADKLDGRQPMVLPIEDLAASMPAGRDPVTDADLTQVSMAGVLQWLRAMYAQQHAIEHPVEG